MMTIPVSLVAGALRRLFVVIALAEACAAAQPHRPALSQTNLTLMVVAQMPLQRRWRLSRIRVGDGRSAVGRCGRLRDGEPHHAPVEPHTRAEQGGTPWAVTARQD